LHFNRATTTTVLADCKIKAGDSLRLDDLLFSVPNTQYHNGAYSISHGIISVVPLLLTDLLLQHQQRV
jgi:hypothetical protein